MSSPNREHWKAHRCIVETCICPDMGIKECRCGIVKGNSLKLDLGQICYCRIRCVTINRGTVFQGSPTIHPIREMISTVMLFALISRFTYLGGEVVGGSALGRNLGLFCYGEVREDRWNIPPNIYMSRFRNSANWSHIKIQVNIERKERNIR